MRQRIENQVKKAIRIASQVDPGFARRCRQLEKRAHTMEGALVAVTADRQAPMVHRKIAAQLLALGGHPDAGRPMFDHFLDCDGTVAWEIGNSFPFRAFRPTPEDERKLECILRRDKEEERRAATAQFLAGIKTTAVQRMLIAALQDRKETGYVRGRAAEALMYRDNEETLNAFVACLGDPDPAARFWAVFVLGHLGQVRRAWREVAIEALKPLVDDTGELLGFWSVGREAQAMMEELVPGRSEDGERERVAILGDPNAPPAQKRWADCYSPAFHGDVVPGSFLEVRYRHLRWYRWRDN